MFPISNGMRQPKNIDFFVPEDVKATVFGLKQAGFEAYIVGGCVRDVLLGKEPLDWDLATNANPEEIVKVFPDSFYENNYGTVGVKTNREGEQVRVIEVTPYRIESKYSDSRHPDKVEFSKDIADDLKRRDFTMNAIAIDIEDGVKGHLIDLYKGQEDIVSKTIRAVGNPEERFAEDGLRIMRAVRFSAQLGFAIESETYKAIEKQKDLLKSIAKERIRDEFVKLIMSDNPLIGLVSCEKLGLLEYICPELQVSIGVKQNQAHAYDVWEHLLRTVQHAADKKFGLEIRLAALFHDIGKPKTRRVSHETGPEPTFYGHDVVGERMTRKIMENLKFSRETIDKVAKFVRWHMFFSDPDLISLSAVRRMVANVGKDNIWDLMHVRECDRIGTGRPKENPYRLRKYKAMIEEVLHDPVSVGMLKIDGKGIMDVTHETPGPKIGFILNALLEEVLDDPKKNTKEYLENRASELIKLDISELKGLAEKGKETKEKLEEEQIAEIRKKHNVK